MAGLDFKSPVKKEQENESVIAHNTRLGLILFFIYLLSYGGFMALSAFSPEVMSSPSIGGVNLSVVYGFALIVEAIILALIYVGLCQKTEQVEK
jgi:uncharacterized membrane protein (DUF485 family)